LLIKIIEEFELNKLDELYNKDLAHRHKPRVETEVIDRNTNISSEDFEPIKIGAANRKIYSNNGVKFIYAKSGDTFYQIAQDFNIYTYQIPTHNDLKKKDQLTEGQMIYIEAKRNKSKTKYHIVQPGESLWDISQLYAIKLKKLCKHNMLNKKSAVYPNQKLKLR